MNNIGKLGCFIIAIFTSCAHGHKKITILPLEMLNYTNAFVDRGESIRTKTDFYLVQNYRDNKVTRNYIDSFVLKNMDSTLKEKTQYSIVFYKESNQTNKENIINNPRIIDRYSQDHDLIYQYSWIDGKFLGKQKIKKGRTVSGGKIKVEDVPE